MAVCKFRNGQGESRIDGQRRLIMADHLLPAFGRVQPEMVSAPQQQLVRSRLGVRPFGEQRLLSWQKLDANSLGNIMGNPCLYGSQIGVRRSILLTPDLSAIGVDEFHRDP